MSIAEYISSGILERYVLGELPTEEATQVEAMAAKHSEVQQEITHVEDTFEVLAMQAAITPRADLKDQILFAIEATSPAGIKSVGSTEPLPEEPTFDQQASRQSTVDDEARPKERKITYLQYGIAASLALAVLSAIAAFYFRDQWKDTQQQLTQILAQNQEIASQYETASQRAERLEEDLSVVTNQDFQQVALAGVEASPDSRAAVYWNPTSSQVYLRPSELPPNPAGQQYQLWAIVDGQPVSAGVFDVNAETDSQLLTMQSIQNAGAFAITLEPQGGSESPTMENMYVQGGVKSS